ncbi:hypothetical protein JCM16303_002977 [Sporobolomyces ruberrimus]
MSRTTLTSLLRLVSSHPTSKLPFLPLLARPHLKVPLAPSQFTCTPRATLDHAFRSTSRYFSSSPFTAARVAFDSEFAQSSHSRTHASDWARTFTKSNKENREREKRDAERIRKHEECVAEIKDKLHRYLVPLYRRLRFKSHQRRPHNWRPAHLSFRTSNIIKILSSARGPRGHGSPSSCSSRPLKLRQKLSLAFFDERRRHHPQRAAHFRYCIQLVRSEVALHFSQGSKAWREDARNHYRWCPKMKFMEKVEAELEVGAGGRGGRHTNECRRPRCEQRKQEGSKGGRGSREDASFDYSTFRKAYWYSRTHSGSRPYNHHREWQRRKNRMMWTRPQVWVMKSQAVTRRRIGTAFFTIHETPSSRRVLGPGGRGGNGGIDKYVPKVKSIRLRVPPPAPTSSILRPSTRPRLSIPLPVASSLFTRTFSSSRPRSGVHFLIPLATALKSTEALHVLVWVTRLSLTLLPLSVRSKAIFALRERYLKDPSSLTASIFSRLASSYYSGRISQPSGILSRWNAFFGLPLLLISPFLLLGLVGIASLERTPVTGRWRFVMVSPKEEEELVEGILSIGRTAHSATTSHVHNGEVEAVAPEGTSLDWVAILRQVLDLPDEGVDPETGRRMLLGGVVLDQRDWRVRWSEAVLRALEKGVVEGLTRGGAGAKGEGEALRPPPSNWPLEGRAVSATSGWKEEFIVSKHLEGKSTELGESGLQVEYDILVIDRDENNAFSFGFAPESASVEEKGRRGVIVVYTGFLKEVLGETALPYQESMPPSSSRLASFFSRPSDARQSRPEPDPIASYLVPSTLPTQEQCKSLAVLLSHEASHLILSHTLESYASMNLLMPHLARLASDVLRTLLYPVTAILGPFINDALGKSLSEGAKGGFGIFGNAANSCESRKLESEADLVALRLLAGSGIDPRFALDFWENRLSNSPSTSSAAPSTTLPFSQVNAVHHHSKENPESATGMLDGYMRTHPVDRERLDKIRQELQSWEDFNRSLDPVAQVA